MSMSNSQAWDESEAAFEAEVYRDAVRDTEVEIFRHAFDAPDPDDELDADILELEQVEGWDGQPLNDDEQLEKIFRNDWSDNDRPLQTDREEAESAEIAGLREEIAQLRGELAQGTSADRAARDAADRAQFRSHLENRGLLPLDEASVAGMHAQSMNRFNSDMARAHEQHGEAFVNAFSALQAGVNRGNAMAKQVASYLRYESVDPGRDLMAFAGSDNQSALGGQPRSVQHLPPSAYARPGESHRGGRSNGGRGKYQPTERDMSEQSGGWGDEDAEYAIFESAFK